MLHLKDTLVCLDDIERKSDSLPMSEIMGLVNYLKNERNCQIIMIMHDEESEDKIYFDKHKEKVFDDLLILNNSLSIIKDNVIEDEKIFSIYEHFYLTMNVKNIRFYQRVQRTLNAILHSSDSNLSFTSKKQILEALLIIRMAHDMPSTFGNTIDFDFFVKSFSSPRVDELRGYELDLAFKLDENRLDDEEKVEVARKFKVMDDVISQFYSYFELSGWSKIITGLLINLDAESDVIEELSRSDRLTEAQLESDREKQELMAEYRNLNPEQDFNQRLFANIKHRIDRELLSNLSFHCNILVKNGASELASQLEDLVKEYIEARVAKGSEEWFVGDYYLRTPVPPDIFYNFLLQTINDQKKGLALNTDASTLSEIFMRFCKHGNDSEDFFEAIQNMSKESFSYVVWQPLSDGIDRIRYIQELLKHPAFRVDIVKLNNGNRVDTAIWHYKKLIDTPKRPPSYQPFIIENKLNEVKQWTLELLQERVSEKPNSSAAVEHLLELTNNLNNI